jgi:meiotically up-regulated gene 157 (Mug157) protein
LATRERVLSADNPWYFESPIAAGIGSPHTGPGMVWPLAIAMAGLTASSAADRLAALRMIEATALADEHIHESFKVDKPEVFTRPWFSWAEMTYVELAFAISEGDSGA